MQPGQLPINLVNDEVVFEYCGLGEHIGRPQILLEFDDANRQLEANRVGLRPGQLPQPNGPPLQSYSPEHIMERIERCHAQTRAFKKPHVRFIGKLTQSHANTTDPMWCKEGVARLIELLKEERYFLSITTRLPSFDEQILGDINWWSVIVNVDFPPPTTLIDTHWWFYFNAPHYQPNPDFKSQGRRLSDFMKRWELIVPPKAVTASVIRFFEEYFEMLSTKFSEQGIGAKSELIFPQIVVMGKDQTDTIPALRRRYVASGWRAL